MIVKKWVIIMNYNIAEYVVGWFFNVLQDCEKMVDLCQQFYVVHKWGIHMDGHTQTHTHWHTSSRARAHGCTPPNAICETATHFILLINTP